MVNTVASELDKTQVQTPGSGPGASQCGVCVFSPCLCGFFPGTLASFHHVRLIGDSQLDVSVCVWLFVCLCRPCDRLVACPGFTPRRFDYYSELSYKSTVEPQMFLVEDETVLLQVK